MSLPKALFEEFSSKMNDVIQSNPAKDIEKNIKSVANSALNKMDLVTRDEFDVQQKMLQKMAAKVAELELRINTLESQNKKVASSSTSRKTTKPKTTKVKTSNTTETNS
ncbi:MAG: accessory factor UbiK family protein [Neisseriaceae bacterium]|nr:accessory factor UbiK family protein [Neisseriaceae bacterium]MCV2509352.1 accessory factor UbiK family protein [Neisseriaceae bacterium]